MYMHMFAYVYYVYTYCNYSKILVSFMNKESACASAHTSNNTTYSAINKTYFIRYMKRY